MVTIPDYSGVSGWKFGARPTVGAIVSVGLKYVMVAGGLMMFAYLVYGGITLMLSRGDPNGVSSGMNKVLYAIVGFLIIFSSYWLIQVVEIVLHLNIL
ncbi:MAG: hypothetical protein ABID04_02155 [Patescibacteria group bacterium]